MKANSVVLENVPIAHSAKRIRAWRDLYDTTEEAEVIVCAGEVLLEKGFRGAGTDGEYISGQFYRILSNPVKGNTHWYLVQDFVNEKVKLWISPKDRMWTYMRIQAKKNSSS